MMSDSDLAITILLNKGFYRSSGGYWMSKDDAELFSEEYVLTTPRHAIAWVGLDWKAEVAALGTVNNVDSDDADPFVKITRPTGYSPTTYKIIYQPKNFDTTASGDIPGLDDPTIDTEIDDFFRETFEWLKPACDCGGDKLKTTHYDWCSTNK